MTLFCCTRNAQGNFTATSKIPDKENDKKTIFTVLKDKKGEMRDFRSFHDFFDD